MPAVASQQGLGASGQLDHPKVTDQGCPLGVSCPGGAGCCMVVVGCPHPSLRRGDDRRIAGQPFNHSLSYPSSTWPWPCPPKLPR